MADESPFLIFKMSDVIYNLQYNYRSHYLESTGDENELKFSKYGLCKLKEPFLKLKPGKNFFWELRICRMTPDARDNPDFVGNIFLLHLSDPECNSLEKGENMYVYVYISGFGIF